MPASGFDGPAAGRMAFLQNKFQCPPIGSSKNLKDLKDGGPVLSPKGPKGPSPLGQKKKDLKDLKDRVLVRNSPSLSLAPWQITCGLMRLRVWRAFDACEGL